MTEKVEAESGLDWKFRKLLESPESFSQTEFERLVDAFGSRFTINDILALVAKRIRGRENDPLEKRALLAIIEGRYKEVEHLFNVIDRRETLGLKVVTSPAPTTPAQSS